MFGQQPAHPFSWHTSMIEGEKSSRNTALISGESRGRKVRGSRTYSNTIAFVAE